MLPRKLPPAIGLMLPLLAMLCSGCASVLPKQVPVVVQRLPLPAQARQPEPEQICVPTCSAGLAKLLDELLQPQTSAAPPASPASASQTRR